jgi:serine phosphatase RsbU (regulator of sigma subunit)
MIFNSNKKFSITLLTLLFYSGFSNAQSIDTVYIHSDSIKGGSIELSDVWRYNPGDDFNWATPSLNVSDWDTVRTKLPVDEDPPINWTGIGWFRTVIKIDSSLRFSSIAFKVLQFGASEFYLNGKLVKKLGTIGAQAQDEVPVQPGDLPFSVILDSSINYVIAVRYSNKISVEDSQWYRSWFGYMGFSLSIREIDDAIISVVNSERTTFAVNIGIAGIFLALALLYCSLFIFYSARKENLYFALFNLSVSIIFVSAMLRRYVESDLVSITIISGISTSFLVFVFPFYLGFIYSIFYKKLPKQFYIIFVLAICLVTIISLSLGEESTADYLILGFIAILTLEGLRVIIVAIKKNKPNSNIIGAGVIVFVLFVLALFTIGILGLNVNSVIGLMIFFLGLLSLPISMSIYLARDIATTNKDLALQLKNVKELSAKELAQKLRAQKAESENERKSKELEEARQLQLSMLPKSLPQLPHLDIAVYMKTATEVGGDYYDFHVEDDGTLTVVIGDATGHGLKAGTMVTTAKSLFNTHASNKDILETFHEFTRVIKNMKMHLMSMCLSLVKINGNKLKLSAAGMPPALLYRKNENRVEELILKGMPLGAYEGFPYQLEETILNPGDTLFLLSDGYPELFNKNMDMFGYERVTDEFLKVADLQPEEIIDKLKDSGSEWIGGKDPDDDVTFVVIKVKRTRLIDPVRS